MMEWNEQIYSGEHSPHQTKNNPSENKSENISPKIEKSIEMSDEGYLSDGFEDLSEEKCSQGESYALPICGTPDSGSAPYENDRIFRTPESKLSKKVTCPNAPLLEKSCSSRRFLSDHEPDAFLSARGDQFKWPKIHPIRINFDSDSEDIFFED